MQRLGTRIGRLCQPPGPRAVHGKNRPKGLTHMRTGQEWAGAQDPEGRETGSRGRTPSARRSIFGRVGIARLGPRDVAGAPRFGPASAPVLDQRGTFSGERRFSAACEPGGFPEARGVRCRVVKWDPCGRNFLTVFARGLVRPLDGRRSGSVRPGADLPVVPDLNDSRPPKTARPRWRRRSPCRRR